PFGQPAIAMDVERIAGIARKGIVPAFEGEAVALHPVADGHHGKARGLGDVERAAATLIAPQEGPPVTGSPGHYGAALRTDADQQLSAFQRGNSGHLAVSAGRALWSADCRAAPRAAGSGRARYTGRRPGC